MEYTIVHELPGRMRLRCPPGSFSHAEAQVIAALLETQDGVREARASFRTGSLLIHYEPRFRDSILKAVQLMDRSFYGGIDPEDESGGTVDKPETLNGLLLPMFGGVAVRALLPPLARAAVALVRALPLLRKGMGCLCQRRLNVAVLDASAVGVSLLRRDYRTASVIMTLLKLGDLLETWTHKKSRESLTDSLALHVDRLWVRRDGQEIQIPMRELQAGDLVVVRMGSVIPVDGVVAEGDAMVNQAAMTGESRPVRRTPGLSVYAGTSVEEGELTIRVTAFDSDTRIQKIADMIQDSEAFKAEVQSRAERMADAIVPWSFLLAGGAWVLTGNVLRASAALMVDYSCALKLATPLAILAAMREGARLGMLVKGGAFWRPWRRRTPSSSTRRGPSPSPPLH